jgi:hypothetical protein
VGCVGCSYLPLTYITQSQLPHDTLAHLDWQCAQTMHNINKRNALSLGQHRLSVYEREARTHGGMPAVYVT